MKDDRLYLIHISESIEKIESYISGMDAASFLEQSLVQDAVLRNLQVLAESTQRLLYCNSFREACRLLGEDKEKRLKKFSQIVCCENYELIYIDAYSNLFKHVTQIILERIDAHKVMITQKMDILKEYIDYSTHFNKEYFQLIEMIEKFINDNKHEATINPSSVKSQEHLSFLKDHLQFIWRFYSSSNVILAINNPLKKTEE